MDNKTAKAIQNLMKTREWEEVEKIYEKYMNAMSNTEGSIKKDTEFNTIWHLAYNEGGKFYLKDFMNLLKRTALSYVE